MAKKLMLVIAIAIFVLGYRYAYSQELSTGTFSVQIGPEWRVIKERPNYVKIMKNYADGQYATIMFTSLVDLASVGHTAQEMRKDTMTLVKETNARFKRFIEAAKLPDLPMIKKVEDVLTDYAKVGATYFVMSSMILVPMAAETFPIGYITMTCQKNGRRYVVIITTRANDIAGSERMLDESLRLVESFRTYDNGQLPI